MNYIKSGEIKLSKLEQNKGIINVKMFHKEPDNINIFYEKLRSF